MGFSTGGQGHFLFVLLAGGRPSGDGAQYSFKNCENFRIHFVLTKFLPQEPMEQLLEGFWGYMIGNMIAVFFVLCQIFGKMQQGQIRYMQIINFSYFVW